MKKKDRSIPARLVLMLVKIAILILIGIVIADLYVVKSTEDQIAAVFDAPEYSMTDGELDTMKALDADCIMVLGASVNGDGTPSPILRDRLDVAIELYNRGVAAKILLSGDNGQMVYNEVQGMKNYAMDAGVPEEDIFMDHAGFSTYESVYRAGYIFGVEKMVVVTQEYHLYRALYGCDRMGIKALGAASDQHDYSGREKREIREVLARDKDLVKWIFKPKPTFLGEKISLSQ